MPTGGEFNIFFFSSLYKIVHIIFFSFLCTSISLSNLRRPQGIFHGDQHWLLPTPSHCAPSQNDGHFYNHKIYTMYI